MLEKSVNLSFDTAQHFWNNYVCSSRTDWSFFLILFHENEMFPKSLKNFNINEKDELYRTLNAESNNLSFKDSCGYVPHTMRTTQFRLCLSQSCYCRTDKTGTFTVVECWVQVSNQSLFLRMQKLIRQKQQKLNLWVAPVARVGRSQMRNSNVFYRMVRWHKVERTILPAVVKSSTVLRQMLWPKPIA